MKREPKKEIAIAAHTQQEMERENGMQIIANGMKQNINTLGIGNAYALCAMCKLQHVNIQYPNRNAWN